MIDSSTTRRIMITISDGVADLLYYDRKEDSQLPRGAIDAAIARGDITVDEVVAEFRRAFSKGIGQ